MKHSPDSWVTEPTKVYRRIGAAPPERAWLRVESGPDLGHEFQLSEGKMVIGRLATNHVILSDPNVSRRHAAVTYKQNGYLLTDLGSTNGTFVNGHAAMERRLRDGDRIGIGQTLMVFNISKRS